MVKQDIATDAFVQKVENLRIGLPGSDVPWLARMRAEGFERFAAMGLPTRKLEAWKYTDLRPLREHEFPFAPAYGQTVAANALPWIGGGVGPRLVFVNGGIRADLSSIASLPAGVTIDSLSKLIRRDPVLVEGDLGRVGRLDGQPLLALNTAFLTDGLVVRIGRGVRLESPIEIAFIGGDPDHSIGYHPRNLIVVEDGGAATVVEHHLGLTERAYFANAVTEVNIGDESTLRHYRAQAEGAGAVHVTTLHALVGRNGTYELFSLATGAGLSRTEASVRLVGEGAHCSLNGAYLLRGKQHCDNTTRIDHEVPRTSCREVFKGVLDDQSRAVFQGRIVVHRQAQGSDGYQLSKALLLSHGAEMDAKPELEIYADDVRCSHGAAVGEIDRDALFYLRSRGLTEHMARSLLIEGFIAEAFEDINSAPVRRALSANISEWLSSTRRRAA